MSSEKLPEEIAWEREAAKTFRAELEMLERQGKLTKKLLMGLLVDVAVQLRKHNLLTTPKQPPKDEGATNVQTQTEST